MRDYELTLVVNPDLTSEDQKELLIRIKKIVSDFEGEVKENQDWGRKELAYPIKKAQSGYFFWWLLSVGEEAVSQLDKKIRGEESLIRYLLVRREERPVPAKTLADKAAGKVASVKTTATKGGKRGAKVTK